jgi:hypothetical protein
VAWFRVQRCWAVLSFATICHSHVSAMVCQPVRPTMSGTTQGKLAGRRYQVDEGQWLQVGGRWEM